MIRYLTNCIVDGKIVEAPECWPLLDGSEPLEKIISYCYKQHLMDKMFYLLIKDRVELNYNKNCAIAHLNYQWLMRN